MNRAGRASAARCVIGFSLLLLAAGCRPATPPSSPAAVSRSERGPLSLSVSVPAREVWVGELVVVAMRFTAPVGYDAVLPEASALSPLAVIATSDPVRRPAGDGWTWERTYTLEPLTAEPLIIPSLTVRYRQSTADPPPDDSTTTGDAIVSEMFSDPLTIEVRSALTSQDSMIAPRDITGVLAPPPMSLGRRLLLAGGLAAAVVGVALLAWYLFVTRRPDSPPEPPEVRAVRALEALSASGLFERGAVREHFYRLSEIVRVYIEEKFGLAAPEMTTEEFLTMLSRPSLNAPFPPQRLRPLLELCDLVKFAAWVPSPEEGPDAVRAARQFIDATAAEANAAIPAMRSMEPSAATTEAGQPS